MSDVRKILKQIHSGDFSAISNLKNQNPDFHWSCLKYKDTGDTVLHCAARLGYTPIVNYLLSFTPNGVNCTNNDNKTPLHEAAQFSQPQIIEILIKNGAFVNALKRADWTSLMLACTKTCFESIKLLVDNGALINYQNKDGWNCMHLAAREGSIKIFQFLVEKNGDYMTRTKNGRSVFHIAALHGQLDIIKFLLKVNKVGVNVKDNCGNTPLHEAVLARNVDICQILIENGADVNCVNNVDFNILLLASSCGYDDMIEYIVKKLKFDVNWRNSRGFTALHCAAKKQHKQTCKFLLSLGCSPDVRDYYGRLAKDYDN